MKRIISLFFLSSALLSSVFAGMKNSTSVTFSVTPIDKDEDDNVQFGGSYLLAESTLSDDYVTLGGKLYYRLNKTDSADTESQKIEIKRAYAKIRPFGTNIFEGAIGKLYSYYLTGGYFSLTETYTGATRWGKSGLGAKTEFSGLTLGLALPATEDYTLFDEDWGLNAAIVYDFSSINEELPLSAGFSLWYSAVGDFEVRAASSKYQDNDKKNNFAECFSLNFSKKNLAFFKTFSVFAAFSHNAEPYVSSSVFKPVSNYSNKNMKSSNLFSLAFRPTIGSVKITSESEIGHSIDGSMVPFYTALQVQFPIFGCVSLKPQFGYYAAYDTSDSSKSFDTWEIYPRFMAEIGKWTITAGWDMFCKEITDSEYRWTWEVPVTAKVKIGK